MTFSDFDQRQAERTLADMNKVTQQATADLHDNEKKLEELKADIARLKKEIPEEEKHLREDRANLSKDEMELPRIQQKLRDIHNKQLDVHKKLERLNYEFTKTLHQSGVKGVKEPPRTYGI